MSEPNDAAPAPAGGDKPSAGTPPPESSRPRGDDEDVVEEDLGEVSDEPPIEDDRAPPGRVLKPIPHKQEETRGQLAQWLIGIFGATVLATFIVAFFASGDADWGKLQEILEILLPAEMALLGSAIGFYFGARSENSTSG